MPSCVGVRLSLRIGISQNAPRCEHACARVSVLRELGRVGVVVSEGAGVNSVGAHE